MKLTFIIFILIIFQLFNFSFAINNNLENDLLSSKSKIRATTQEESTFSSNVPIFVIMTAEGTNLLAQTYSNAYMNVYWNPNGERNYLTDTPFLSIKTKAAYKGHSSLEFRKKQIGIKTLDNNWDSKVDVDFPGMNIGTGFRFTASYSDKSLMRNKLVYTLARKIAGTSDWGAPDTQFCEVFLVKDVSNGIFPSASKLKSNYYYGAFLLGETVERDSNRVNIAKLKSSDTSSDKISGGYLIKLDRPREDDNVCEGDAVYLIEYPEPDDINSAQNKYICNFLHEFERSFGNGNYESYLDLNIAAEAYIIQEFTKNVDAFRNSFFMYKQRDSKKFILRPAYDFDIALGNANYRESYLPNGLNSDTAGPYLWWMRWLLTDPTFKKKVGTRWSELRESILSTSKIDGYIDSFKSQLQESQERNFQKWTILGDYVWPNPEPIPTTWNGEITALKNWIHSRLTFLDTKFGSWKN